MAALLALVIGALVAGGVWLLLRQRGWSVVLGLSLLAHATNLFILAAGRPGRGGPVADPLPQALVLTAIVIGLGMTAFVVAMVLRGAAARGSDRLDDGPVDDTAEEDAP